MSISKLFIYILSISLANILSFTSLNANSLTSPTKALELGNKALLCKQNQKAKNYYQEVISHAKTNQQLIIFSKLNRARLLPVKERITELNDLILSIEKIDSFHDKTTALLNISKQAQTLGQKQLSFSALESIDFQQISKIENKTLYAEYFDIKSQLYEDAQRYQEALSLVDLAIDAAASLNEFTTELIFPEL